MANQRDHQRATTSRKARGQRKKTKQPPNVQLQVKGDVANTIKQAAQAADLSPTDWIGMIAETLLEDEAMPGQALRFYMTDLHPVAQGTDSVPVRLPAPLWAKVEERAALDGQRPMLWLSKVCYYASLYRENWYATGPVGQLKRKHALLEARGFAVEARTLKERAFKPLRDDLSMLVNEKRREYDHMCQGPYGVLASRGLGEFLKDRQAELTRIEEGRCEWEELNTYISGQTDAAEKLQRLVRSLNLNHL